MSPSPCLIPMVWCLLLHSEGDVRRQRVGVWSKWLWQELLIQSPGRGEIHCPKPGALLSLDATRKMVPFLILPMWSNATSGMCALVFVCASALASVWRRAD